MWYYCPRLKFWKCGNVVCVLSVPCMCNWAYPYILHRRMYNNMCISMLPYLDIPTQCMYTHTRTHKYTHVYNTHSHAHPTRDALLLLHLLHVLVHIYIYIYIYI
jgi:hypothetical protein